VFSLGNPTYYSFCNILIISFTTLCELLNRWTKYELIASSTSPHLASRAQLHYALKCLDPTIFNLCIESLVNLSDQLTRCGTCQKYKIGYGSILVSFLLERVPCMRPLLSTPFSRPSDPKMRRWTNCMAHLNGRLPLSTFSNIYFIGGMRKSLSLRIFRIHEYILDMTLIFPYHSGLSGETSIKQTTLCFCNFLNFQCFCVFGICIFFGI